LHHIVIRGIEGKAIFKGDTDREAFLEQIQFDGIDLSTVNAAVYRCLKIEDKGLSSPKKHLTIARARTLISYVATQILSISGSEVARWFNVDRSAIIRASQRVSRGPELPAATNTIQRGLEFERNQH
jgi:chromosomal replication initiation ATPase DnaA